MHFGNSILRKLLMFNILSLVFISLLGCDIQFGGGGNNDGGDSFETLTGTVTMITPNTIPVEGTVVVINDDLDLSATLSSSGFFMIQGLFSSDPANPTILEFREQQDSEPFAQTSPIVYRGATVELSTITITNGVVDIPTTVTNFNGTVLQNNCTDNSGTLRVQTRNTNPKVFVTVNIIASTNITGCTNEDNQICLCQDIGTKVKVRGILKSGNVVDAGTLTIK